MTSAGQLTMSHPNLCCPQCGQQMPQYYTAILDLSSFEKFAASFNCPSCEASIHPEDAYLEFLQRVPLNDVMGYAFSVGGFTEIGTEEIQVGTTEEIELFESDFWSISDVLFAETDRVGGLRTADLDGTTFKWHLGKLLIDDQVIVDGIPVENNKIGIITSQRGGKDIDTVTIAYLIKTDIETIQQPPWVDLLNTASRLFWRNQSVTIPPILISAYDNHISRQLQRTLVSQGKSNADIESFFEQHYRWKEQAKEGLEAVTGTRLNNKIPKVYSKLANIRHKRDNHVIHVDADDDLAVINASDAIEMISTVMQAILAVYELCYSARNGS